MVSLRNSYIDQTGTVLHRDKQTQRRDDLTSFHNETSCRQLMTARRRRMNTYICVYITIKPVLAIKKKKKATTWRVKAFGRGSRDVREEM